MRGMRWGQARARAHRMRRRACAWRARGVRAIQRVAPGVWRNVADHLIAWRPWIDRSIVICSWMTMREVCDSAIVIFSPTSSRISSSASSLGTGRVS